MPHMAWARQALHAAHLYVLGYRRAAEHLQLEVIRSSSEEIVLPLLFLWRQHGAPLRDAGMRSPCPFPGSPAQPITH